MNKILIDTYMLKHKLISLNMTNATNQAVLKTNNNILDSVLKNI